MIDKPKKLKLFAPDDITEIGKTPADVNPHSDITVVPSPLGVYETLGYKCEHGVYIPCTSFDPNRAEFCSLCNPYLVQVKEA